MCIMTPLLPDGEFSGIICQQDNRLVFILNTSGNSASFKNMEQNFRQKALFFQQNSTPFFWEAFSGDKTALKARVRQIRAEYGFDRLCAAA